MKPLGHKTYGSIPHLPGSRTGPKDYTISDGQARIATQKKRDKHDLIVVQEKLDGSCCGIANIDGSIVALGRAGYRAETSRFEQHQLFAHWVRERQDLFTNLLQPGERVVGEWMAQAHGTRYYLHDGPFIPFDIFDTKNQRLIASVVESRVHAVGLPTPMVLNDGEPTSIADALEVLGRGAYGAVEGAEGAVWRVEHRYRVDFLCKYVVPWKKDGCYLPEISGQDPIWNWRPKT